MSTVTHAPKGLEGVVATTSSICYIDGEQGVLAYRENVRWAGLEGIVATTSSICYIDGGRGILAYRGIDIHELADHSTFEEVCHLLWFGKLPTRNELRELRDRMAEERKLDASIIHRLHLAPKHALPMDVLRTIVSALSFYDPEEKYNDRDANVHKAIRLTAQIAMLVAAYDRIRKGKEIVEPDRSLSHAANFLLMLNGDRPSATAERALDIALILHADHELNASTFAARVTAATLSDMHSAITSAIGALKGPLHGGANEAVFRILEAISTSGADPVEYVKGMLAQKKKIPGFGHRVYHTEDPRATHLRTMSRDLGTSSGETKWFDYSRARDAMFTATDTRTAPWHILRSDDKRRMRLNCIAHLLKAIPHGTIDRPAVSLPPRSRKHAYDDEATLSRRRFVRERY